MNFWSLLIDGLTQLLVTILAPLPDGIVNPVLGNAAVIANYAIVPVLFFVGPFINLGFFVAVVGTMITIEVVRMVVAGIRWVYKLIPAAG